MVAKSDVGKVRKFNEDHFGLFEEDNLAILCDGMGGHNAGDVASQLGVDVTQRMYHSLDRQIHIKIAADLDHTYQEKAAPLVSAIRLANRHIYNESKRASANHGMGTTISALAIKDNCACICHVGDSRIYRLRGKKLELLTEDHSWLNELIQDKEIKQEDAYQFEHKNVITRALGIAPTVKIDLRLEPIQAGDLFLLCSDGLTNALLDGEIRRIILYNQNDLNTAAMQLIESANLKDGSDNITVTFVKILEHNNTNEEVLPVSLTLKNEIEEISLVENKILKKELSHQGMLTRITNSVFKQKIPILIVLFFIIIIFVKYSFNHQHIENNIQQSGDSNKAEQENLTLMKQSENPALSNNTSTVQDFNLREPNDSLKKAIIKNERILTKSLNRSVQDKGLIYLVGLENLLDKKKTFIYLNDILLGNSRKFIENGIRLKPGQYTIAIKDTNNVILYQLDEILLTAGDVKAIELKRASMKKNN